MITEISRPVFSVVMPMYNVAEYVAKSIKSVLDQDFKHFELICVNDGCTDDTLDVVHQFDDNRIRVIDQENMGLAAARNTGIQASRGLFIALLDSDDFWHPSKLRLHLEHFNANPEIGVSYSASKFVDTHNKELGIGQYPKTDNISQKDVFCRNPIGNGSAAVIRRKVLFDIAYTRHNTKESRLCFFDETLRQSEDIDFWLKIVLDTQWQVGGIPEALTYYRVNSSGLSANLEKQLNSWHTSIKKHQNQHPEFFKTWYSLGLAYQFRYLSRRAVQSGNRWAALRYLAKALASDSRIVAEEPRRTLTTSACVLLSFLPMPVYRFVERSIMQIAGFSKQLFEPGTGTKHLRKYSS